MFHKKNSGGFTLVEVMIVVAILVILASIAGPQYKKYTARAKQADAKAILAQLHSVQQSFKAQHGTYHYCLNAMGFRLPGYTPVNVGPSIYFPAAGTKAFYSIGAGSVTLPTRSVPTLAQLQLADDEIQCTNTGYTDFLTSSRECFITSVPGEAAFGKYPSERYSEITGGTLPQAFKDTYTNAVMGCPVGSLNEDTNFNKLDTWTVNEDKVISNIQPGF